MERFLADEQATDRFGNDLAAALKPGDILALHGDLGMGKTALARAIIRSIAADPELEVPSPTFTLAQSYALRVPVHHFDLYRLSDPEELEELGLDEAAAGGIVLVEWPERSAGALADAIRLNLSEGNGGRIVEIQAPEDAFRRIEHAFAIRGFLENADYGAGRRAFLLGDASVRAYETVTPERGRQLILMDAPRRHDEPIIRDGKTYIQIAHLAESVTAFVGVANGLRDAGFAAPRIFAQDLEAGLLLIEHLGEEAFLAANGSPVPERYKAAARLLARMHEYDWPRSFPVANGVDYAPPSFDRPALQIETELLLDWYLPDVKGRRASRGERQAFNRAWSGLFDRLLAAEQSLVLRDYHSPNIIWRQDKQGQERLGLIDVQDAVFGPTTYDLSSLAFDARVTVDQNLEEAIFEAYCAARTATNFDRVVCAEAYAIAAAQRNTRLLGTFVRLASRDGKPAYLRHLPRIRDYLKRVMAHPALSELDSLYRDYGLLEDDPA